MKRVPGTGPAALSVAMHGALVLLLALAFGQGRPLPAAKGRTLPVIMLGAALPRPVLAQAQPPPAPRHASRRVQRAVHDVAPLPLPPVAQLGDTRVAAAEPAAPVTASAEPAVPLEQAAAADAAPAASGPTSPPPLLYLAEVSRLIRLSLDYPEQARLDRAKGTAVVRILLARDGTVLSVELVRGAGHPALDAEARGVVLRIHKFPGLPEYYARGEQRFAIEQPIGFVGG